MTEYDPTNPLISGSFIDNADISYMTRIEVQGAGITDVYDPAGTTTLTVDEWLAEKTGYGYLAPLLPAAKDSSDRRADSQIPTQRSPSSIRRWHSRSTIQSSPTSPTPRCSPILALPPVWNGIGRPISPIRLSPPHTET